LNPGVAHAGAGAGAKDGKGGGCGGDARGGCGCATGVAPPKRFWLKVDVAPDSGLADGVASRTKKPAPPEDADAAEAGVARPPPRGEGVCFPGAKAKPPPSTVKPPPGEKASPPAEPPGDAPLMEARACCGGRGPPERAARALVAAGANGTMARSNSPRALQGRVRASAPPLARASRRAVVGARNGYA
jgi:hypothetical protein